jgi:hypothetical protein
MAAPRLPVALLSRSRQRTPARVGSAAQASLANVSFGISMNSASVSVPAGKRLRMSSNRPSSVWRKHTPATSARDLRRLLHGQGIGGDVPSVLGAGHQFLRRREQRAAQILVMIGRRSSSRLDLQDFLSTIVFLALYIAFGDLLVATSVSIAAAIAQLICAHQGRNARLRDLWQPGAGHRARRRHAVDARPALRARQALDRHFAVGFIMLRGG